MPAPRGVVPAALALFILASSPVVAMPPEVQNLVFVSRDGLTWDGLPAAAGYHVYRGELSGLAQGTFGSCLLGSLQAPAATVAGNPPAGEGYFYLSAAFDGMGQGPAGFSSVGVPITPQTICIPNRRSFALMESAGLDGLPDAEPAPGGSEETIWQGFMESVSVMTHSGEVVVRDGGWGMASGLNKTRGACVCSTPQPEARARMMDIARERSGDPYGRTVDWHYEEDDEDMLGLMARRTFTIKIKDVAPLGRGGAMNKLRGMISFLANKGGRGLLKGGPFSLDGKRLSNQGVIKARRNQESDTLDVAMCKWEPVFLAGGNNNEDSLRYRSGIRYDGPLGQGWDFPANAHLVEQGLDVGWSDGSGRLHLFQSLGGGAFASPPGVFSVLRRQANGSFILRHPDGTFDQYSALDGSSIHGALLSRSDDARSVATFLYDYQGLLTTAVDSLGRATTFTYDAAGRVVSITDFSGRSAQYGYDSMGDLVSVTSPAVMGTPNGNDFPSGKTTRYAYTSGFGDERLNHNMIAITAPREEVNGGPARLQIAYGEDPTTFDYDRAVLATVGAPPSVGGTLSFVHLPLNPGADPMQLDIPRRQMTMLDQNGNEARFFHSRSGHRLLFDDRTNRELRPGEPDYVTQYSYDAEGRLLGTLMPEGNQLLFAYDSAGADRYRQGNLLEARVVADPLATGGRGDGHRGELADIVWNFTYEPMRNDLASLTDPLGRVTTWLYDYQEGDPLATGLLAKAAQHGVSLGGTPISLGDLNGDGRLDQILALPVRIQEPTVMLDPASRQAIVEGDAAQERVTLRVHDDHGLLITEADEVGNRNTFTYFPETDPDGDGIDTPPPPDGRTLDPVAGGYLASAAFGVDPVGGASAQVSYRRDVRGTIRWRVDPRGVSTVFIHNQLDQLVELREAASTADSSGPHGDPSTGYGEPGLAPLGLRTWVHYDANDNIVKVEREDVGQTRQVGTTVDTTFDYDLLNRLVATQQEEAPGESQVTGYDYDAAGNLIRRTWPTGRTDEYAYDERHLLLSSTRGASGPLGGTPATRQYEYDGSGSMTRMTDARGGLTDYEYDGAGRLVRAVDQTGSTSESFLDLAGRVTRVLERGPAGGPTPPDRSGATNVDLSDATLSYDEADRQTGVLRRLIVAGAAGMARAPVVVEGTLVPGDGAINAVSEYDAAGRQTFATDDMGATSQYTYDVLGRVALATSPAGRVHRFVWNAASDLAEQEVVESPSATGPPSEQFLTSYFYDAMGRRTMTVDNAGRAHRFVWDSFSDVGNASDARGPAGGSIIRRGQVVPINGHGNITNYTYDAAGRLVRTEQVLTASGEGDGTLTPTPAPTPFNPDGRKHVFMTWGKDDRLASSRDDAGNETLYQYDNLGRRVREQADDGTATQYGYDTEGNVVSIVDANGSALTQTFDPRASRIRVNINPSQPAGGTTLQEFEYDGVGRLTRATDNNLPSNTADDSTIEFFYDSLGRVLEETQRLSNGTPTGVVDSHWLAENRRTTLVTVSDDQIHYGHDLPGRVTSVSDPVRGLSASYQYLGPERVAVRTLGNGVRTTMLNDAGTADIGYDETGRLKLMRHISGGGTTGSVLLSGFEYKYDAADNRVSQLRAHQPGPTGTAMGERYTWDSVGRMTLFHEGMLNAQHQPAGPTVDSQSWSLDGDDNWAQFTRNGVPYQNTPNNLNEYDEPQSGGMRVDDGIPDDFGDSLLTTAADGANQGHDKNGSRTADGTLRYQYDGLGRLIRIGTVGQGPPIATYLYDPLGRRALRVMTEAAVVIEGRLFYDGPRVIEEYADSVVARRTAYGHGSRPLWQVRGDGTSQYLLEDGEGSAVAVVDSGSPTVLERTTYDAYGKPTFEGATGMPLLDVNGNFVAASPMGSREGFGGMRYDAESGQRTSDPGTDRGGLYCVRGQCYDPDQGRVLGPYSFNNAPAGVQIEITSSQLPMRRDGFSYNHDVGGGELSRGVQMVRFFLKKKQGCAAGRLIIQPEKGDKVEVMFNPKEYTITKSTPWKHHDSQGLDAPELEFTSGEPYRLEVELFFDDYEQGKSGRGYIFQHNQTDLGFLKEIRSLSSSYNTDVEIIIKK